MRNRACLVAASAALWLLPLRAQAIQLFFSVPLDGMQEVDAQGNPNQGDLDGSGTAQLFLDTDMDTISWVIGVDAINLPPTGAHIHEGAIGTNGPIRIDFNAQLSGGPLVSSFVDLVAANPEGFYVNVHNDPFFAGAIRGQIPEPATALLVAAGVVLLAGQRRRS